MSLLLKNRTAEPRIKELESVEDLRSCWNLVDFLILPNQKSKRFIVGFATSQQAIIEALRLRYEVFNLELQEGLAESHLTGLDEDEYDQQMTHLVLLERDTLNVAGTYRLQTAAQALARRGFYSSREFDLGGLAPYFGALVECGRACISSEHRSLAAIMQLWLGIRAFCQLNRQRWLFGCCSITSRNPQDGWRAHHALNQLGALDPEICLRATQNFSCGAPVTAHQHEQDEPIALPKLFSAYLRLGASVISEPAIDHEFGTVDFLVLLDALNVGMSSLEQ